MTAILTAAEEEATKPKKPVGGLSDALLCGFDKELSVDVVFDENAPYARQQPRPSSAMMTDFLNTDYSENVVRHTRSEAHTPDSPHSTCTEIDDNAPNSLLDDTLENCNLMRPLGRIRTTSTGDEAMKSFQMNLLSQKKTSLSMERLSRGPGKVSVFSDKANIQVRTHTHTLVFIPFALDRNAAGAIARFLIHSEGPPAARSCVPSAMQSR